MRRIKTLVLLGIIAVTLLVACQEQEKGAEQDSISIVEESMMSNKLHVYVLGLQYTIQLSEEEIVEHFPSAYSAGLSYTHHPYGYENGNMIYQALLDFAKENDVDLEVAFFGDSRTLAKQLEKDYQAGNLPDLVLDMKTSAFDFASMISKGMIEDVSSYLQYEPEEYYDAVMQSGWKDEQQYLVPFLFNVNGYVTSEEYLTMMGAEIPDHSTTYEELMEIFQTVCLSESVIEGNAALYETSNMDSSYLTKVLWAGGSYLGLQDGSRVEEEMLEAIYDTMETFYKQEFIYIPLYQDNAFMDNYLSNNSKYSRMLTYSKITEDATYKPSKVGILLDGGYSGTIFYSNYIMQVYSMQTYYLEEELTPVVGAIPLYEATDRYSANVTGFAFCPEGTENIELATQAMKYLMDYPFAMELGISVNRKNTERTIDELTRTSLMFNIAPDYDIKATADVQKKKLEQSEVWFEPLDKDIAEELKYVLDHVVGANIPHRQMVDTIRDDMMEYFVGNLTRKEAVDQTYEVIQQQWDLLS